MRLRMDVDDDRMVFWRSTSRRRRSGAILPVIADPPRQFVGYLDHSIHGEAMPLIAGH